MSAFRDLVRKVNEDKKASAVTEQERASSFAELVAKVNDGTYKVGSTLSHSDVDGWNRGVEDISRQASSYLAGDGYKVPNADLISSIDTYLSKADHVGQYIRSNKLNFQDYGKAYQGYVDAVDYLKDLKKHVQSANDYFGQWETEEDYNAAVAAQKAYEDQIHFDTEAGAKEIEKLERIYHEYSVLTRSMLNDEDQRREDEIRSQYGDLNELEGLINKKKAYLNNAKRIQKGVALASASGNEDFDTYKGYVSTKSDGWWDELTSKYGMGYDDLTYEYINNQNGLRDEILQKTTAWNADGDPLSKVESLKLYDHMTPDEVTVYNYYYAKAGKAAAEEYLDSIQETLNYRSAQERFGKLEGKTALELLFGVEAGLDQFESGMKNLFNGDDYIAPSDTQIMSGMVRDDLGKTGPKLPEWMGGASLGQVGYDAINTTSNMAPSILASMAVGTISKSAGAWVGNILMGSSAAGNAYQDMLNQGYTKEQSASYGVLVGVSEVALEKVLGGITALGGGGLSKFVTANLSKVDNVLSKFAQSAGGKILLNAGSEAIEEGVQSILEPYFKSIVSGDEFTADKAEVLYSALMGFVTGGIFEGGNTAVDNAQTKNLYGASQQELVAEALEIDPDNAFAKKMQGILDSGKSLTGSQLNKLVQMNEAAVEQGKGGAEAAQQAQRVENTSTDNVNAADVAEPQGLRLPSVENDVKPQNVTQSDPNVTVSLAPDVDAPKSASISVAERLRQEQDLNGGTQYEGAYERTDGSAAAQSGGGNPAAGGGLLLAGGQRYDGTSTGEQVGSLAGRARKTAPGDQAGVDAARASVQRTNIGKNLRSEKISSTDLGLQNGTDTKCLRIIPEEYWDDSMAAKAEQVYQETGRQVTYILGGIQVRNARGNIIYAKGVDTGDRIIVQANHTRYSAEQIADHEAYHGMTDPKNYGQRLNDRIVEQIEKAFSREEFDQVLNNYIYALSGIYDLGSARDGAEYEQRMNGIVEELLADAHAGMNMWGAGAAKFTNTVNRFLDDSYISRKSEQDNGTESPTGPPTERFSIDTINGEKADYGVGVVLDTNIFQGVRPREWGEVLGKYVYDNLAGAELIVYDSQGNQERIYIAKTNDRARKDGAKNSHKVIDKIARYRGDNIKALATVHLSELLITSRYENATSEQSHQWLDENGWEYRKTYIQDRNGNIYEATLNIANGKDRRILYDINNIRQIDKKRVARGVVPSTNDGRGSLTKSNSPMERIAEPDGIVKERFSYEGDSTEEYSNRDTAYMDAVNRGDTAAAQKMVDEAAKAAGYTVKAYHGTSNNFWEFRKGHKRTRGSLNFGDGFYFAPSRSYAENYTNTGRVIEGYLKLNNPYTIYGTRVDSSDYARISTETGADVTIENITEVLKVHGYDGIIARSYNGTTNPVNQYVIFDSNQVKSADPVTYDDNGNVIPLSERFYEKKSDIRFSVDDIDSLGNDLSQEQQEYFAQSQARDDDGRLLVVYHQTDNDFTIFDTRHPGAGSRDSDTPFGIFLKRSAGDIGLAGKKQMALYTNITNPLRATNREDLTQQLREISDRYASIADQHKKLDAEYHEKFEQAKKAWLDYIIEWRTANPGANRNALNDDPKFNELYDAEDTVVDEWTAAADLLSTQAKEAITEDLRKAGYDGVFLENDVGSWGRRTDAIIALDPQQVKNISNKTPTSNPDIRYSVDDGGQDPAQQQPVAPKKKIRPVAESRPLIAKKDLRSTVLNLFSIPNGQRAEVGTMIDSYADRLIKNGSLTEDDRKTFFDRMYDAGVMVMPAEEYSAFARSHIVDGRIYVSDSVKADFGDDWADIRRRAFAAGVYLVNDRSASGIDQWNATLSAEDMLPGLFDSEETDDRTILERIIQVAEEGKDEHLSLAEYTRRLSQQEGISEDEFLDNMERQLDWALRTFAEKARLEVHLRDRTGRKIAQEREKGNERMTRQQAKEAQRRADERQARKDSARRAKERRELRELQQRTLKQLQWLSKNRNRAPEELQATWDEVLGDIDLYAISAADEMRWSDKHNATWKDLAQMYKDAMKNDPNFLPSKELERIVTRLDATKIADMDLGALQDLYKAAIGLRTEFYNRNNVINDEMQRLFAEVYTDAKREIESAPGGFTGGVADKFLNLDQLTPMNVLQRMAGWDPDGAFYSMAKQLERGERDMRAYSVKAKNMLQDFLTEHEDWVKKADGQGKDAIWYEVEVPQLLELGMGDKPIFGPTVKVYMTPAQKVHMYLESKNLDNLRHMTGGRTFVNKDLYSQGKRQESLSQGRTIKLAPETVRKLVSDLTPEEMELAQILDRYYNTFATQEINKVSNILYGYDKAMGKNYAPIYTNRNYTKTEFGVFDTTAEGVGNLKGRQYAVNPSYNISAFDAFERHVDQTARFCGMAIPARNWTTLMNWREKNNSTGDVITHKWGEESKRYITDLITTLQAGDDVKTDTISSGLSKLQSNYITAIFGANPSIVLKQLGSIPLAGAYLDARNMPTPAQISKIDRSLISKYTQELEWRTMGYATPETKQLKDNPNWTQTNKAFKFVFGGGAITAMDGWAASTLWPWAENKVRREHPELAVGTKAQVEAGESAFYKKVAEEFENAVSRSQSVSDEIHQGTLRKSKNPITKAFTMFRSDSAQTYNALRQKIGEARYYMRIGAKDKVQAASKKAVGTVICALLMNTVWSEAVSFLVALWKNKGKYYRDDEDELTAESVIGEMGRNMMESIMGTVTFGDEIAQLIGNAITGDRRYDLEAPGLEQINEILNLVQDLLQGNFGRISEAADVVKNGGNLGEYLSDNSGEIMGEIKDTATKVATYFGLPVNNVEAYLLGTLKWVSPELGAAYDDLFQSIGKSDLAGMEGDALEGRIGRILSDRNVSESDDTAAALAALYEAGYKTAIPSDTPTYVSIDGEKHSLGVYQQQAYDTVWGSIVADALDDMVASDSFAEADPETQAKMLSNLYNYAAARAKDELFDEYEPDSSVEKNAAIIAAGASVAECFTLSGSLSNLQPSEGSDRVTDIQRWRECVDFSTNEAIQLAALAGVMTDKQYAKVNVAYEYDVSPAEYVTLRETLVKYDANGNGSLSNSEVTDAINSMRGLSKKQKAVLWQLSVSSKSAKNNPYSPEIGEQVLKALSKE